MLCPSPSPCFQAKQWLLAKLRRLCSCIIRPSAAPGQLASPRSQINNWVQAERKPDPDNARAASGVSSAVDCGAASLKSVRMAENSASSGDDSDDNARIVDMFVRDESAIENPKSAFLAGTKLGLPQHETQTKAFVEAVELDGLAEDRNGVGTARLLQQDGLETDPRSKKVALLLVSPAVVLPFVRIIVVSAALHITPRRGPESLQVRHRLGRMRICSPPWTTKTKR